MSLTDPLPSPLLGLFIQPACLQHRYIRHPNSSHIFERPERLRAVLLGVAAAIARLEEADEALQSAIKLSGSTGGGGGHGGGEDLSSLLSSLSIASVAFVPPERHLDIVPPPLATTPGQILLHHPGLQLAHSPPPDDASGFGSNALPSSKYLKDLYKWASEAVESIKETGCEIPGGLGLNQGDLYLGPGSILAIEGAIQTVCQAIDKVCEAISSLPLLPSTPPVQTTPPQTFLDPQRSATRHFKKAFCAIRPPGHHCGEDTPSGFCYVNNVVTGAMHAYLEHDIDRAIIIDFDLHHGNGTQALVMPLNAASHAEDLAVKAGKPPSSVLGKKGKQKRGWKGFYGSVHDIYSYPCEDGDLDLISDASICLAAHGQYIENIHLQPYADEADFYARIYPKYLALLEKAKSFMDDTGAEPERTIILISAGFDACEHEYPAMQRHSRRVPVSFFSRYTKDIVHFADRYTDGKVVSVLEGGYSDRALMSAGMGHVIGMLGRQGEKGWWEEAELCNLEKATKKKRTGKIAPFPTEMSHLPHLVRTHALLAHFEGGSSDAAVHSAATTPQHGSGSRMTLRGRRKVEDEEESVTPPQTLGRRAGASVLKGTPRGKGVVGEGTPLKKSVAVGGRSGSPTKGAAGVAKREPASGEGTGPGVEVDLSEAIKGMAGVKIDRSSADAVAKSPHPSLARVDPARVPLPASPATHLKTENAVPAAPAEETTEKAGQPKIILRFTRPAPSQTPVLSDTQSSELYPPLPGVPISQSNVLENGRMAYREQSASASSGAGEETEEEYQTAPSGSDTRGEREGTADSRASGPGMPGGYTR